MKNFFVFDVPITSYRNGYVLAQPNEPMGWEQAIQWSKIDISLVQTSFNFCFTVRPNVPHPDAYPVAVTHNFQLFSSKAIDTIKIFTVKHETFDACILNKKTGDAILQDREYKVFRLLEAFPFAKETIAPNWTVQSLDVLKGAERDAPHLFLNAGSTRVFASEEFKSAIEANGVTGCRFRTIEKFMQDQVMRGTPI